MKKDLITVEVEGQHVAWSNELNEINDELKRYEEILAKLVSPTNKKKIEHFQNQFFIQRNVIAKLKNEIKKHNFAIEREGNKPFDEMKASDMDYHEKIAEKIEMELKIIKELKMEFDAFVKEQ